MSLQPRFLSRTWLFAVLSCVALSSALRAADSAPLKRYLYLGFPDGAQAPVSPHAPGIAVYDIDDGHKLVRFISIPQFGQVQSLNVSIAASIASYEYLRQHVLFEPDCEQK